MRKVSSLALVFALTLLGVPMSAGAAPRARVAQPGQTGNVTGHALDATKKPLSNYTVRIRNLDANGQIAGSTTSDTAGGFSFNGLQAGHYVVEIVNSAGEVVGTSTSLAVTAGATIAISVSAAAVGAITAAAAGGGFSLLGLGTLASVVVITGAGIAAVAGVVAVNNNASPSR